MMILKLLSDMSPISLTPLEGRFVHFSIRVVKLMGSCCHCDQQRLPLQYSGLILGPLPLAVLTCLPCAISPHYTNPGTPPWHGCGPGIITREETGRCCSSYSRHSGLCCQTSLSERRTMVYRCTAGLCGDNPALPDRTGI